MCRRDLPAFSPPCRRNHLHNRQSLPLNLLPRSQQGALAQPRPHILRSLQRTVLRRVLVLLPRLRRQMFARRMDGKISAATTQISEVFLALVVPTMRPSFAQIFITLASLRRKLIP